MKRLLFKAIPLALTLSLAFTGAGLASTTAPDNVQIVSQSEHQLVVIPSENVLDKGSYEQAVSELLPQQANAAEGDVGIQNYTKYISNSDYIPYSGSSVYAWFSSRIDYNLCCSTWVSGNSRGVWQGTNPWNADQITLTDRITFTGVNISVSVPASAGFSVSGNSAVWSQSVNNTWRMDHTYSNISSTGYDIYVSQSTSASFRFGSSFYTPNASAGTWL